MHIFIYICDRLTVFNVWIICKTEIVFLSYVDSSRMISVELGGEGDLKTKMIEKANKYGGTFGHNAQTHDYNIVKMSEHYMKRGNYVSALRLISEIAKSPLATTVSISIL